MPTIHPLVVKPSLPEPLRALDAIARNLWWSWNPAAIELFLRIDRDLWHQVNHNPLALLGRVPQSTLESLAADDGFRGLLAEVHKALVDYLAAPGPYARESGLEPVAGAALPVDAFPSRRIGYFSAEFGLNEAVPIYSGGLGVLAGDHLKSASDLGLPLAGVGLLYREVFHQYLNADGWQQEVHPETDVTLLPVTLQRRPDGTPLVVTCELPGRTLHARVWRLDVGRVPLFLLDSNLAENTPEDQRITDRLYGGDLDMRIRQEILLGIGGLRALHAVGLPPAVCHMNEGHSAFLALERVRLVMKQHRLPFGEARELAAAGNAFTTHTPVPAGNDRFPPEMVDRYFSAWRDVLGLSRDEFLALGRETPTDPLEHFCMTVLALKLAAHSNGVSALHGKVSRAMWKRVYPGVPVDEVPIGAIVNGVHQRSFVAPDMRRLYDSYLGPRWHEEPEKASSWERVHRIPDEELWRAHEHGRERVVAFVRDRLRQHLERRGAGARELAAAADVLDPHALTIGFARRAATYKRATLVLRDLERLGRILNDAKRPVQLVFAGKAHQKDEPGKEVIRRVVHLANQADFRHRIVYLEDYDMNVARHLVQGVDMWLNTPVRPLEASGTSGMKAVLNGAIHVSVVDGWWAEAAPGTGWNIGNGEEYADREVADRIEADALYHLLETEIVPHFYERGKDGLPHAWLERMKASITRLAPVFNTHRMVRDYESSTYAPLARRVERLSADGAGPARALAAYKHRVAKEWSKVAVRGVQAAHPEIAVNQPLPVRAWVSLGDLSTDDVAVQLVHGPTDTRGELTTSTVVDMTPAGRDGDQWAYATSIALAQSGRFGFAVRIVPRNPDLASPFEFVPVRWH